MLQPSRTSFSTRARSIRMSRTWSFACRPASVLFRCVRGRMPSVSASVRHENIGSALCESSGDERPSFSSQLSAALLEALPTPLLLLHLVVEHRRFLLQFRLAAVLRHRSKLIPSSPTVKFVLSFFLITTIPHFSCSRHV